MLNVVEARALTRIRATIIERKPDTSYNHREKAEDDIIIEKKIRMKVLGLKFRNLFLIFLCLLLVRISFGQQQQQEPIKSKRSLNGSLDFGMAHCLSSRFHFIGEPNTVSYKNLYSRVLVYRNEDASLTPTAVLTIREMETNFEDSGFGSALAATSNSILVVGAPNLQAFGAVIIYSTANLFQKMVIIRGTDEYGEFGSVVGINGDDSRGLLVASSPMVDEGGGKVSIYSYEVLTMASTNGGDEEEEKEARDEIDVRLVEVLFGRNYASEHVGFGALVAMNDRFLVTSSFNDVGILSTERISFVLVFDLDEFIVKQQNVKNNARNYNTKSSQSSQNLVTGLDLYGWMRGKWQGGGVHPRYTIRGFTDTGFGANSLAIGDTQIFVGATELPLCNITMCRGGVFVFEIQDLDAVISTNELVYTPPDFVIKPDMQHGMVNGFGSALGISGNYLVVGFTAHSIVLVYDVRDFLWSTLEELAQELENDDKVPSKQLFALSLSIGPSSSARPGPMWKTRSIAIRGNRVAVGVIGSYPFNANSALSLSFMLPIPDQDIQNIQKKNEKKTVGKFIQDQINNSAKLSATIYYIFCVVVVCAWATLAALAGRRQRVWGDRGLPVVAAEYSHRTPRSDLPLARAQRISNNPNDSNGMYFAV